APHSGQNTPGTGAPHFGQSFEITLAHGPVEPARAWHRAPYPRLSVARSPCARRRTVFAKLAVCKVITQGGSRRWGSKALCGSGQRPLVVGLAVGRALHDSTEHDVPRDLEVRERGAQELADLIGHGWGGGTDDGYDALSEALVWEADDEAVLDEGMTLDRLFDLLGEDLLAARVDAVRP